MLDRFHALVELVHGHGDAEFRHVQAIVRGERSGRPIDRAFGARERREAGALEAVKFVVSFLGLRPIEELIPGHPRLTERDGLATTLASLSPG